MILYMLYLLALLLSFTPYISFAQSKLLETVKRNPQEAKALCKSFKEMNSKGISSYSEKGIRQIGLERNLNTIDSEVLVVYVIGMYCPERY